MACQDAINNNEQLNIILVKRSIKIEPQKQALDNCHKDTHKQLSKIPILPHLLSIFKCKENNNIWLSL